MLSNISVLILLSLSLILSSCTSEKNVKASGSPAPTQIPTPEKPKTPESDSNKDPGNDSPTSPIVDIPSTPTTEYFSRILCETSTSSQFMTFSSNASISTYPQLVKMYYGQNPDIESEITQLNQPLLLKNEQNLLTTLFTGKYADRKSLFQAKVDLSRSYGLSVKLADVYAPTELHTNAQINLGLLPLFYDAQIDLENSATEIIYSDLNLKKYVYLNSQLQPTTIPLSAANVLRPQFIKDSDFISFYQLNANYTYEILLYSKTQKSIVPFVKALSTEHSQTALIKLEQNFYWLETDQKTLTLRSISTNLNPQTLQKINLKKNPNDKINFQMSFAEVDQKQYLVLNQESYKPNTNQKVTLVSGQILMIEVASGVFANISSLDYPASAYESANRFGLSQVMGQGLYFSKPQNKLFIRLRDLDGFMSYHSYDFKNKNWNAHHIFTCGFSSHLEEAQ